MTSTPVIAALRAANPVREHHSGSEALSAEILASPADPRLRQGSSWPKGRWPRRRLALAAAAAAIACAAAALALTSPLSGSSGAVAQAAILRVFRDGSRAGPPLPRGFAKAYARTGPLGEKFGLLPSSTVYVATNPSYRVWLTPGTRGTCIVARAPDGGTGGSCTSTADTLRGGLRAKIAAAHAKVVEIFGVAPDGDATVAVTYRHGTTRTIPVLHNVYTVRDANTATAVKLRTAAGNYIRSHS